jgi:Domain of Unknown Function (DUF928)
VTSVLLAQSGTPPNPSSNPSKSGSAPSKRLQSVHAKKLSGFELSPAPANGGTQIAGASRGTGTVTILLAPNKGQVYTLTPVFQWTNGSKEPITFKFQLLASDRQSVLFETKVSGNSLKYPASAPALAAGGDYFWTVGPTISLLGEAPAPAEFLIIGGSQRSELEHRLASASDDHTRARMFVDMRLWYDAVEAYTRLIEQNPSNRKIRQERAEIYNQLPQTRELAAHDMAKLVGAHHSLPFAESLSSVPTHAK